jgi:hypothetical protein
MLYAASMYYIVRHGRGYFKIKQSCVGYCGKEMCFYIVFSLHRIKKSNIWKKTAVTYFKALFQYWRRETRHNH